MANVDTIFCPPTICMSDLENSKNIILSIGPRKHLDWCGVTRLGIGALKVHFSAKMPLFNPRLTKSQTKSKSSQNNIFHGFTSNPSYLKPFVNFDQVWPSLTLMTPVGLENPNFDMIVRTG